MGRKPHSTSEKIASIRALFNAGLSQKAISVEVNRSRGAVQNALRSNNTDARPEHRGRKRRMSKRVARAVVRKGRQGEYTANMLRSQLRLPVGVRRIQQILASTEFCEYEKRVKAPRLSSAHRAARLNWCEKLLGSRAHTGDS